MLYLAVHKSLIEKFDQSGFNIIDRADQADFFILDHFAQYDALFNNTFNTSFHLNARDFLDKFTVFRVSFIAHGFFVIDRRLNFIQKRRKVSHLNIVAGALDRSAFRMPEHDDKFEPATLQANSIEPRMSSFMIVPAMRMLKISPKP